MRFLVKFVRSGSLLSLNLRKKRFDLFLELLKNSKVKSLLDVGGDPAFWRDIKFKENIRISIFNLPEVIREHMKEGDFGYFAGDACVMKQFKNKEFDFIFSNSVIEHVGDFTRQKMMADEIKRVGKNYFVQTPNFWFPFEPHFLMFGFQFLPLRMKALLLRRFDLGWFKKVDDYNKSIRLARSIRLLTKKDLQELFPEAIIVPEKFLGLSKSFMIYKLEKIAQD
jgi:hypothetical protein